MIRENEYLSQISSSSGCIVQQEADLRSRRLCSDVSAAWWRWTAPYTSCTSSLRCHESSEEPASPARLSASKLNKRVSMTTWKTGSLRRLFDAALTETSSTSFRAFLNDSFFCWKISMVSRKACERQKNNESDFFRVLILDERETMTGVALPWSSRPCLAPSWGEEKTGGFYYSNSNSTGDYRLHGQ